jgi:hypothetical protein
MKNILLFSIPIILLVTSCSENDSTEPITYTDAELKEKIVGEWSGSFGNITFEANGNFTENIDIDYTFEDSSFSYNQKEVIKGTYEIENGILIESFNEWEVINSTPFGGGYVPPSSKIVFTKNSLLLYPLEICTRVGDNADSLWGEWYTFYWTHNYFDPDEFGKLEQSYNFNQDSMTVTIGSKYPFDSSGVYYQTNTLFYNPPEISWLNANISMILEFHGGQMYMFYKLSHAPSPLIRQK